MNSKDDTIPFDEMVAKLHKFDLFSDFNPENELDKVAFEKIIQMLTVKEFSKGDAIITEGDLGDSLYMLLAGSVRILRNTPSNEQFAVVNLSAEYNVFFGEIAIVDEDKRSATVMALTDCKTLTINRHDFHKLCQEEPAIGIRIALRISKRICASLRKANSDITTLYQALLEEVEGDY